MHTVRFRVIGDVVTLTFKERQGRLIVSSQNTRRRREVGSIVEQLNELTHFENVGTVINGDPEVMRKAIKGETIHMKEEEQ